MVLGVGPAIIGILITVALAMAAVLARALTPLAGATAATFGSVIVVLAGFPYLSLLVLFVVASVLATRYGFEEKMARHVQEGVRGERGVSNVLAHIALPTALVIVAFAWPAVLSDADLALLFTAAIAFGAADTFASEFGVLSGGARSILTFRKVIPGTNGGVSGVGELWAFIGAFVTAIVALVLFAAFNSPAPSAVVLVVGATIAGFLACQVDSVLGETLENRGYLTKGSTNFIAMLASVAMAVPFLLGGSG